MEIKIHLTTDRVSVGNADLNLKLLILDSKTKNPFSLSKDVHFLIATQGLSLRAIWAKYSPKEPKFHPILGRSGSLPKKIFFFFLGFILSAHHRQDLMSV